MAKKVLFYTIAFYSNNGVTNYSVTAFLEELARTLEETETPVQLERKVDERWIRIFPFYYTDQHRQIVIPFGKYKNKNKPYWINDDQELEEVPKELFDINSIGYDTDNNVLLVTTNREGPSVQNIQNYLNTFIPNGIGLTLKIEPIMYNSGIERVRNAQLVRELELSLDLGQPLNNFYQNEIESNRGAGRLADAFRTFTQVSREATEGKKLSISLGVGKNSKKLDSLDIESVLYLLNQINIDAQFIKEIIVKYKNAPDEKIDVARLKQSEMSLFYNCTCNESQVSPQVLRDNINNAIADKMTYVIPYLRNYFLNMEQYGGEIFEVVRDWHDN